MRAKFSRVLTDAALKNKRILLLTGDHGYALFDEFRKECPDQFINCGIAEQNMVGVAAGLAKVGFLPIVYGLAAFVPMRVLEQIKMDVCYEPLKVIFIGDGAGVVYSTLGPSHQCTEDIAALRALPNLNIFSPCDVFELEYCFEEMLKSPLPSYFRFGKSDLGNVHQAKVDVAVGDLVEIKNANSKRAIIATGSMVSAGAKIAAELGDISLYSAPAIAPFNKAQLVKIAASYETIFVLEEHSVSGGLGGLIAETISAEKTSKPTQIIRIGIKNKFSEVCGDYAYVMGTHGLSADEIKKVIQDNS